MCGIAAVLLHPQQRPAEQWQAIREIFTRNLLFNEERGRDAAGLVVIQQDGQAELCKMPLPASEFVQQDAYQRVLAAAGPQTTLILGHTRLPTKGSPDSDFNNHPLHTGPVFGVHNGHIPNDDEMFARFGFDRQGQVDSEIIFRMLAAVDPSHTPGGYLQRVRPQLELLQGQYTFLACDQRTPAQLTVLKHNNPLCMHYHAPWEALVFSSRYIFLRKAFGQSVATEALPHDRLLLYDARAIPACHDQTVDAVPLYDDTSTAAICCAPPYSVENI